jgi:hypothetical protein
LSNFLKVIIFTFFFHTEFYLSKKYQGRLLSSSPWRSAAGAAAHHCGGKLNQALNRVKGLFQLFATMMRCRAGGGPPRGGAYQTTLIFYLNIKGEAWTNEFENPVQ